MSILRRFARDESGMTMGLAVIMILLMSVMGAGLLAFVSKDLNNVVEVNQGQRAFEVADAGIGAAGRQLSSGVVRGEYDDDPDAAPVDDIQWSAAQGGLTLENLDGSATTSDSVNVTIEYKAETADIPEHFEVISTGTYGDPARMATRKIEAIFKGVETDSGGESIGHPLYYTPSDIKIEATTTLNGISLFSEKDILIQNVTDPPSFVTEYEASGGTLSIPAANDELCNWDSATPLSNCFEDAEGPWNTVGRTLTKTNGSTVDFEEPGFAAEGKICGFTALEINTKGTCGTSESTADGVYGYDSTTGAKVMSRAGYTKPWGNNLTFVDKGSSEENDEGTISYPFPRPTPIPEGFKEKACFPTSPSPTPDVSTCVPSSTNDYFVGNPTAAQWDTLLNASDPNRIAFIDASTAPGGVINFDPPGSAQYKGILVVWCGQLQQNQSFQGIVLNLYGDGTEFGSTNCADDAALGTFKNNGQVCQCWMYAEGGTETRAGIHLGPNSRIRFLPSGDWGFLSDLFESPPPESFDLQGWRELYE